jgi:hypothetical protein
LIKQLQWIKRETQKLLFREDNENISRSNSENKWRNMMLVKEKLRMRRERAELLKKIRNQKQGRSIRKTGLERRI